MMEQKRKNKKLRDIGIVRDILNSEIRINVDSGRVMRPLFIVEKEKLKIKKREIRRLDVEGNAEYLGDQVKGEKLEFDDLMEKSLIELLDVEEEESSMIAMRIEDVHNNNN